MRTDRWTCQCRGNSKVRLIWLSRNPLKLVTPKFSSHPNLFVVPPTPRSHPHLTPFSLSLSPTPFSIYRQVWPTLFSLSPQASHCPFIPCTPFEARHCQFCVGLLFLHWASTFAATFHRRATKLFLGKVFSLLGNFSSSVSPTTSNPTFSAWHPSSSSSCS